MPEDPLDGERSGERSREDPRLFSPAFSSNFSPISHELQRLLGDKTGDVVEIGSGSGQHVITFAAMMPHLTWWPSDLDHANLASIEAWRALSGLSNVMAPIRLNAALADWRIGEDDRPAQDDLLAILSINVVHIAPWSVAEGLFRSAGRNLRPGGYLCLYGPFTREGAHIAPSNAAFDASLRAQNPEWGVRDLADLKALATASHLELADVIDLSANNSFLHFTRDRSA